MRPALFACIAAAAGGFCTAQAQVPGRVVAVKGALAHAIEADLSLLATDGFSGAIVVEQDDAVILRAGYGWANRARRIPFTATTIAQVGSLTKQFTATALVDLALKGRVGFGDALSKHLAEVPPQARAITLQQLLTHTAGLPSACGDDFDRVSRDELVSRCLADFAPPAEPRFAYSNLGYSLLGAVVEGAGGAPLEDYLAEQFFKPLGMTHTGYFFGEALHGELAVADSGSEPEPPISDRLRNLAPSFWNLKGNGGMQASADDMYRWYRALKDGPVISAAMRKELITPHVWRDEEVAYGYGWFVRVGADGLAEQISHTGSDGVFFAAFVWRPADRFFYYLVTSSGETVGAEAASAVLRRFREQSSKDN